ncbi:MAG: hypothetical protein MJ192_06825 [Clostridia bacterium]|nr:hypothetical protein [Clostridia bacterium]
MKKFLCVLLACLMVLPLAACANTEDNPDDTSAGTKEANSEEDTRESLDIPDTKYTDVELTFLTRDNGEWTTVDICPQENAQFNQVQDAVYERNEIMKDRYGITICEIQTTTTVADVQKETSAPTGDFQAVVGCLSDTCTMVNNTYLVDLNGEGCEYLDFDKSWWDHGLAENMTIDGHLYFATGDLLTADNDGTFAILFNKKIANEIQLPDMYELVDNKKWTMDKMYEFEQLAFQDKDGDGKLAYDTDICGFAYTGDTPYSLLYGGGVSIITRDEDDNLVYSLDVQRTSDIADKSQLILSKDLTVDMNAAGGSVVEVGQKCFGENHCLYFGECLQCVTRMRSYDVDFGIVPYPKFDEAQKNYCSVMEWVGGVVSIPRSVNNDLEMVCSMIEGMAYYAVPTLTNLYYELNLKTKMAKDEQSGPMIDMILEYRVYDLAYAFQWSGVVGALAGAMKPGSKTKVASASTKYQKQLDKEITKLLQKIEKAENS